MRHVSLVVLFAMALWASVIRPAQAITVTLLNDPVADGIITEDGVSGYQYYYDVTFDYGGEINFVQADAAFLLGGTDGPLGAAGSFDGTQSAWYREAASDSNRRGVWQTWYHSSVGNSCFFGSCEAKDVNLPAAISDDDGNWDLNVIDAAGEFGPAGGAVPWSMVNPYHDPSYFNKQDASLMEPGGLLSPTEGLSWRNLSSIVTGNGWIPVPAMTIRVVHPNAPGDMNYRLTMDAWGFPAEGTVQGPTGEPFSGPVCGAGDADCDGDVDLDDIIAAVGHFTGPCTAGINCLGDPGNGGSSFNRVRTQGDVNDGAPVVGELPLFGDGDTDLDDIIDMVGAFTGPLDGEAVVAAAEAGDAGLPDLIYDSFTGEVFLDGVDIGGTLQAYNIKNAGGGILNGNFAAILGGPPATDLPTEIGEFQLSPTATAPGGTSIGLVFPTGMDQAALEAFVTGGSASPSFGGGSFVWELFAINVGPEVPEPATVALLAIGLLGLAAIRTRRRLS